MITTKKVKVLEKVWWKVFLSMDEEMFDDVIEDCEIYLNKEKLDKELEKSIKSWKWLTI